MGEHDDLENTNNDHDLLLIVAKDARYILGELKKQNGRIAVLETWQQRVVYTFAGVMLASPLAFPDVRQLLVEILGG